jgi:hypothetical protein
VRAARNISLVEVENPALSGHARTRFRGYPMRIPLAVVVALFTARLRGLCVVSERAAWAVGEGGTIGRLDAGLRPAGR